MNYDDFDATFYDGFADATKKDWYRDLSATAEARRKRREEAARAYDKAAAEARSHRPSPVDLQDADIRVSEAQRAYLRVFDEWVKNWRTRDTDDLLKRRKDNAFNLMATEAGLDMTKTREFKKMAKRTAHTLSDAEAVKVQDAKRRAALRQKAA
jgi:hypothetical protein